MKKKSELKFESALDRLEKIVEVLESGESELNESLKLFEEGIELIRFCQDRLEEVKGKVEILAKKGKELIPEPYDETSSKRQT
jgi:exodeoxyribonuclease VII small subunit